MDFGYQKQEEADIDMKSQQLKTLCVLIFCSIPQILLIVVTQLRWKKFQLQSSQKKVYNFLTFPQGMFSCEGYFA